MANQYELILIFVAVLFGVVSAAYFYSSTGIFMNFLGRPLKLIAAGMFVIAVGVLLAAFISFEANAGVNINLYSIPLPIFFYALYLIGSIMIALGARKFAKHSKPVASAV